ncbi:hypothetical protein [Vibrio navarrensis]|uniref:hypothetical protein n=1 Tax=Vibrio navarrensis TaxID=29495 RepID=UPI001559C348|nr:hypothetical protein [Vibrio navarrensis]
MSKKNVSGDNQDKRQRVVPEQSNNGKIKQEVPTRSNGKEEYITQSQSTPPRPTKGK